MRTLCQHCRFCRLLYQGPGLAEGGLDRVGDGDEADAALERAAALDQPELALPRLELQLHVADEQGALPVEDARMRDEDALDRRDEVRRGILEAHRHRIRSGTGSKPIACSSA